MDAEAIAQAILTGIGIVSALSTMLPNSSTKTWLNWALRIVNLVGMNWGKSKNA